MDKYNVMLSLLVAVSLLISGCGGGSSANPGSDPNTGGNSGGSNLPLTIGGTITGNDASVTLSLNGTEETFTSSPFIFTADLAEGDQYMVLFVSTPANQQCTIVNGAGTIASSVSNISVTCTDPITLLQYQDAQITGIMRSGDFDGDGFIDLVFSILTLETHPTGSNNSMFRVTYGNGTGSFSGITDIPRLNSSDADKRGHLLVAGDFNGDGLNDFAYAGGNVLELFSGDPARIHPSIYRVNDITRVIGAPIYAIDTDNDDDLDIITLQSSLFLTENIGGNFDGTTIYSSDLISATNLITGDFNGDNINDVLIIGLNGINDINLAVFAGNISGGFDLPSSITPLSNDLFMGGNAFDLPSKDLAAGDFDGDGLLDVAITSTTDFVQIMMGNGAGGFTVGQRVIVGTRPIHVRAADFDLDGITDLATINQDSKTIIISLGNGDGTFADNTGSDVRSISILLDRDVDLFDMDIANIDGGNYPDIILAENGTNPPNTGRGSVQIFLNPAR